MGLRCFNISPCQAGSLVRPSRSRRVLFFFFFPFFFYIYTAERVDSHGPAAAVLDVYTAAVKVESSPASESPSPLQFRRNSYGRKGRAARAELSLR